MKKGPHNMMSVPNYGHVYVKFIDYVANHPKCTWKDINSHVHPGKPLYTSRTEFMDLCPKYVAKAGKSGPSFLYEVTADGLQMIEVAKKTKWLFDFIDAVNSTKASTLVELDIQLALQGSHYFVEADFLKKFLDLRNDFDWNNENMPIWRIAERRLGHKLLDEIVMRAEELNPGWAKA